VVGTDSPIALGRLDVASERGIAIDTKRRLIGRDVDRAETRGPAAGRSGAVSGSVTDRAVLQPARRA